LRKKVVGPAFSGAKIASYEPIISKHVEEFLKRTADPRKRSSRVNVAPIVQYLTSDTMIEILFGDGMCRHPYSNQEASRDVHAAMRNLSKYAWGGSLLPWFGWLMNTAPMQYLMRRPAFDANGNIIGLAALVILSKKLIEEKPEKAVDSLQQSIVKNYLEVPKDDSRHMSLGQIWGECFNLTLAGPGSTAAAITSILYQLGTPEGFQWQKRIQHEARAKQEVPASAIALVTAVIKETLRLNAPFPTAFPREIMAGAENSIPSATAPLPVGTVVSASTFILGRSKEIWGEDAELWKPERWLVDEEELRELDEKFVAFSKGARGCIGKDLAMLLITKTLIGVLREFEITISGRLVWKSFLEMQYEVCEVRLSRCKERWNFFSK
jgi:benzoate 4-monooxygenase